MDYRVRVEQKRPCQEVQKSVPTPAQIYGVDTLMGHQFLPWYFPALSDEIQPMQQHGEIQPIQQHGEIQPLSQHGEIQPLSQHGEIQTLSQHGEIQPMQQHGEIQPLSQHGQIQPLSQHGEMQPMQQHGEIQTLSQHGEIQPMRQHAQIHYQHVQHPHLRDAPHFAVPPALWVPPAVQEPHAATSCANTTLHNVEVASSSCDRYEELRLLVETHEKLLRHLSCDHQKQLMQVQQLFVQERKELQARLEKRGTKLRKQLENFQEQERTAQESIHMSILFTEAIIAGTRIVEVEDRI
jgi:hypothetical protein